MNETESQRELERLERDFGKDLVRTLESANIGGFLESCGIIYQKMHARVTVQEMMSLGMVDFGNPETKNTVEKFLKETESLEPIIPKSIRESVRKEISLTIKH